MTQVSGIKVGVAFSDTAFATAPTFTRLDTDITGVAVQSISIDRGRSGEFDKNETGTATITFVDIHGALDPSNATSPLYGDVDPNKQAFIELYNPVTDAYGRLFTGFTEDWSFEMDDSEEVIHGTVTLTGPFGLLAGLEMTPGDVGDTAPAGSEGDIYFNEDTGLDACQTRLNKVLDDVGWPAALREVFTGNVGLQGSVYARLDSALSVLYDTADAEFPGVANIFERKDGAIVFHGRFARFDPSNPDYNITTWKAGDDTACAASPTDTARISKPFQFTRGKNRLINRALGVPQNIDETDVLGNLVTDSGSILQYGWSSESFDNLLTLNGDGPTTAVEETKKFATYYVDNYAIPRNRVDSVTFRSQRPAGMYGTPQWALLTGVDISDIIALTTTHPGGGGFGEDFYVEGIHYEILPGAPNVPDVTLRLDLSPAAYYDTSPF